MPPGRPRLLRRCLFSPAPRRAPARRALRHREDPLQRLAGYSAARTAAAVGVGEIQRRRCPALSVGRDLTLRLSSIPGSPARGERGASVLIVTGEQGSISAEFGAALEQAQHTLRAISPPVSQAGRP